MDTYEVAILYHPDLEIDLDKGASKVKKIIADNGGKVVAEDVWGKRKLAYKIGKNEHAVYAFYDVELPAGAPVKVEAAFNITDEVIRFLVTKPDLTAIAKAKEAKAQRKRQDTPASDKDDKKEDSKESKE